LHQKVGERFTELKNLPSLRFLCVDTDRSDISRLNRGIGGETTLAASETLHLPLRKPEDYRNRQKHLLTWLSRRWIYNVPRSQQTEGIRPLGRLAFIDNFTDVYDAIGDQVEKLSKLELLAETSEKLGMTPGTAQDVQVFLVASISGGVGSGMMADMAYTIKLILGEHGLSSNSIHGLMLNSSSLQAGDPGLASTNSFAFLTELRHYNQYGFPGDASQGLPELPNESPFDYSYFMDLGSDLSEEQMDSKFDSVAEYLFLKTVTPASRFFDECHKLEAEIEHFSLRSVGLSRAGFGPSKWNEFYVEHLCKALIAKWATGTDETKQTGNTLIENFKNSEASFDADHVLEHIKFVTKDLRENPRVVGLRDFLALALGKQHSFDIIQFTEQAETVFGSLDLSSITTQAAELNS